MANTQPGRPVPSSLGHSWIISFTFNLHTSAPSHNLKTRSFWRAANLPPLCSPSHRCRRAADHLLGLRLASSYAAPFVSPQLSATSNLITNARQHPCVGVERLLTVGLPSCCHAPPHRVSHVCFSLLPHTVVTCVMCHLVFASACETTQARSRKYSTLTWLLLRSWLGHFALTNVSWRRSMPWLQHTAQVAH